LTPYRYILKPRKGLLFHNVETNIVRYDFGSFVFGVHPLISGA